MPVRGVIARKYFTGPTPNHQLKTITKNAKYAKCKKCKKASCFKD